MRADPRLRPVDLLGGRREASAVQHREEGPQPVEFHPRIVPGIGHRGTHGRPRITRGSSWGNPDVVLELGTGPRTPFRVSRNGSFLPPDALEPGGGPAFLDALPITQCRRGPFAPGRGRRRDADGRQLDRVRAIGDEQDHFDPHDLHRGECALAHRDRPSGRVAGVDHAPAHLRAGVVAAAGAHRLGELPRRPAAAHDRRGGATPPTVTERAPWVLEDLAAATRSRARLGVPAGLEVAYIEKLPGHRSVSSFCRAATLPVAPTALGRALLAFSGSESSTPSSPPACGPTPRTPSPRRTGCAARSP